MTKQVAIRPTDKLKSVMQHSSVQEQFKNALGKHSDVFVASLIDLFGSETDLQKCNPKAVVMEALKAAVLKLPVNKNLGFAYIVPYGSIPQFQIGYKGLIQLALRTGQYRYINSDVLYEGEIVSKDRLTGEIILGEPTRNSIVGYFAMFETINGFRRVECWSKDEVIAHAKKFAKGYNNKKMPWQTNFDSMAKKTVLRSALGKYGIMSIEMSTAFATDNSGERSFEEAQSEVDENANTEMIDVTQSVVSDEATPGAVVGAEIDAKTKMTPEEIAEVENAEKAESDGPGF